MKKHFILAAVCSLLFSMQLFAQQEKFKKVKPHPSITMKIPEGFVEMLEEDVAERYITARRPTMVYTDLEKQVDLDVNITINDWGSDMILLKDFYKSTILQTHKKVEWLNDSVRTINKRDYAWLEYKSSFDDRGRGVKKHYTSIMFTTIENRIIVVSFRCNQRKMKKWRGVADQVFNSIKMKSKLLKTKEQKQKEKEAKKKGEELDEQKKVAPVTPKFIPGKAPQKPK